MSVYQIALQKNTQNFTKSDNLIGVKTKKGRFKRFFQKLRRKKRKFRSKYGDFHVVESELSGKKLNAFLDQLRKDGDLEVATHIYHFGDSMQPVVPTGKLRVLFAKSASKKERKQLIDNYHLKIEGYFKEDYVLEVTPKSSNPIKTGEAMLLSKHVAGIKIEVEAVNIPVETNEPSPEPVPTPPARSVSARIKAAGLFKFEWHLQNEGDIVGVVEAKGNLTKNCDANVVAAWKQLGHLGSPTVKVGVCDNNFDTGHPDFTSMRHESYKTLVPPVTDVDKGKQSHGTLCLGVIAANGRLLGVSPDCKFFFGKLFRFLTRASLQTP